MYVRAQWANKGAFFSFKALRKLNAVTVPMMVKVPKTQEEDDQMRAAREG